MCTILDQAPQGARRTGGATCRSTCIGARALRDDPGRHRPREVRRGRLDHARDHGGARRRLLPHQAALQPRGAGDSRGSTRSCRRRTTSRARSTRRRAATTAMHGKPARGRAGGGRADAGRAGGGPLRGRLRRPRPPRAPHAAPHVPGALQGRGLRQRRGGRLRRLQGRRSGRGAREAHAREPRRATSASAARSGSRRRAPTRSAPRSRSRPSGSAPSSARSTPKALVVAGQLIFEEDTLWNRILHNETAFLIQQRLQHVGVPMIVIPVRLNLRERRPERPQRPTRRPSMGSGRAKERAARVELALRSSRWKSRTVALASRYAPAPKNEPVFSRTRRARRSEAELKQTLASMTSRDD